MAFGQIDPARLNGDALARWYLRSPADIERERQAAAAQKYDSFFGGLRDRGQADDEPLPQPDGSAGPDNRWQAASANPAQASRPDTALSSPKDQLDPAGSGRYQLAAASPGYWLTWGPTGCANCHGYTPNTLPPVGGHSPFPPSYSPRSGSSDGSGGSPPRSGRGESPGNNPPQCAIQYDNDSAICRRVPDNDVRRECWASAGEREGYCIRSKGRVGFPSLITR